MKVLSSYLAKTGSLNVKNFFGIIYNYLFHFFDIFVGKNGPQSYFGCHFLSREVSGRSQKKNSLIYLGFKIPAKKFSA